MLTNGFIGNRSMSSGVNDRASVMNGDNIHIGLTEEQMLSFEVSDEALESAAGTARDSAGSVTLAFCSGLDSCPA